MTRPTLPAAQPGDQNVSARADSTHYGLAHHSLVYFAGSVTSVLGGVLMLPVYTHALTTAQYGVLETVLRFVSICMLVAFLGIRQAYMRLYFDDPSSEWHRTLTATVLALNFAIALIAMLPVLVFGAALGGRFGLPNMTVGLSAAIVMWLAFEATYLQGLSSLQVQVKSSRYTIAQGLRLLLLLGTNYILLHHFRMELRGALLGNFLASLISGTVSAVLLYRQAGLHASWSTMIRMIRFGLPYIPSAAFFYVISNADRFAIISFGAIATLGILSLASKLGELALSVFAGPIESVWGPYAFANWQTPDGARGIGLLYTRYTALCILLALGVSLAAPLAIRILASPSYRPAADLVPIVATGWVFNVVATLSDIGILIAKRTALKPLITAAVALTAVVLQIVLTPRYGVYGAAVATATSYALFFAITRTVANHFYRMTLRNGVFLVLILGAGLGYAAGHAVMSVVPTVPGNVLGIVIGTSIYAVALHIAGAITVADVLAAARKLTARGHAS